MRGIGRGALLALVLTTPALSQDVSPGLRVGHSAWTRPLVHYGKWAAAALAVGFTAMGAHEHQNSNRAFSELLDTCRADPATCTLGANGTYLDPAPEQLYQTSINYDRRARTRLLLGQLSLLASAGLFLADLQHHVNGPDNIPYHGLEVTVEPGGTGARVGVRLKI